MTRHDLTCYFSPNVFPLGKAADALTAKLLVHLYLLHRFVNSGDGVDTSFCSFSDISPCVKIALVL